MEIGEIVQLKTGDSSSITRKIRVKNSVVFGGITLTGVISAIVSLLAAGLINIPGYQLNRKLNKQLFQIELLDHVLRIQDSTDRLNSIKLLINVDQLPSNDYLMNIGKSDIPSWYDLDKFESKVGRFSGTDNSNNGGNNDTPEGNPVEPNPPQGQLININR